MRHLALAVAAALVSTHAHADSPFDHPRPPVKVTPVTPSDAPAPHDLRADADATTCDCKIVDRGKDQRRAALWVATGGVALWGVAVAYGLKVRADYHRDPPAIDYETARYRLRYIDTGLVLGGAAVIGVAAYLYFTAPTRETVSRTAVAPYAGSDQFGVAVSGGF